MNLKPMPKPILLIVLVVLVGSCSNLTPNSPEGVSKTPVVQDLPISQTDHESCLQAARKFLGSDAVMLKCGHLIDAAHLEAVVAIRVPGLKDDEKGIPISKLKILRRDQSQWETDLNVDMEIMNSAGYVGFNFIDDSHPFPYYRITFADRGAAWGAPVSRRFTLGLVSMSRSGQIDKSEIGMAIGWNPAVGRFQEIEPNGEEFAPEVKNPKHIRSSK